MENTSATKVKLDGAAKPMNDQLLWLDADGIGRMLSLSARHVRERIACQPDFPKPLRIGGLGHPRWLASEIQEWAIAQRERQSA